MEALQNAAEAAAERARSKATAYAADMRHVLTRKLGDTPLSDTALGARLRDELLSDTEALCDFAARPFVHGPALEPELDAFAAHFHGLDARAVHLADARGTLLRLSEQIATVPATLESALSPPLQPQIDAVSVGVARLLAGEEPHEARRAERLLDADEHAQQRREQLEAAVHEQVQRIDTRFEQAAEKLSAASGQ
jgi:hypothetical protein